jgi:GAF domain-containing protein
MPKYKELLEEFEGYARSSRKLDVLMEHIARRLHEQIARYNWVGFYLMENSVPKVLVLGPHSGSFTPHARIPLHQGLCGAAATTEKTIVVNNVAADPRYIGGEMVKSNMVVPIKVKSRVAAELDIESYFADTFSKTDQEFVESCAALVGRYMETHP